MNKLILLIIIIAVIIYIDLYTDSKLIKFARQFIGIEAYTEMDPIFNNYITNKGSQRSYEDKYRMPFATPFKNLGSMKSVISNILDNTMGLTQPEPKCLECEGALNKTVFFRQGRDSYLAWKNSTVKMVSKSSLTPAEFMQCCRWKLVLGLSGDDNTCSLLHMETDNYLIRLPDNRVILQAAEIVHGNELTRQMATFRLIDSLANRADVSIMPLAIGKETRVRVIEISADNNKPRVVEYENELLLDYKATSFECVDTLNEYTVFSNRFTVNGFHKCNNASQNQDGVLMSKIEPMTDLGLGNRKKEHLQDITNSSSRRCNKSSGKRMIASCVAEDELTPNELSESELFQNIPATTKPLTFFRTDFDPKTANIFDKHTGAEFNAILNAGVSQNRDELSDKLFYKLEDAKLDPNVENLLEYNEVRYNIYKKENDDFENKIYDRIKNHTDTVDNLIVDMNNYRVKNMAQDFFFLGDKLIKSRGSNSS